MSESSIRGSCVCGGVQYTIREPFITFQNCHCTRCRKASGSAYLSNLFVPVDQLKWEAGEEHVKRYELPTAKYWSHCFCDTCGSALPWLTRTGKAYIVPAGTLDDDPGVRPKRRIYFGSRAPWFVPGHELETCEDGPPRG